MSLLAVPATPEPVKLELADGSVVSVRLCGDENFSYYTSLTGEPVRLTDSGMLEYYSFAELEQHRSLAAAAPRRAQANGPRRVAGAFPLSGSPKGLVILVNYKDLSFSVNNANQAYTRLLNESGYSDNGGYGSARDYFIACSDSIFRPDFDVYGPYTLANNMSYYGGNNDANASAMILEAVQLAYQDGVDIKQYDTDNDGYIDNVFVYYAGHNEAEGGPSNSVWPHRSVCTSPNARVDGKRVYDYACTSEYRGSSGTSMCGIGTFVHEFGHVLGLPDFYKTTDNSSGSSTYTVGSWDVMASGSYNGNGKTPPSYSSYERFYLGWLVPEQLVDAGGYVLEPLATTNKAYLVAATTHNLSGQQPSPNEFFMIENRQNVGWDAPQTALPYTGMLVWHIDYSSSAWSQNTPNNGNPLRYHIVNSHSPVYSSGGSETFPGAYGVTTCNLELHDGTNLFQPLLNIAQVGENITFSFKKEGNSSLLFFPDVITSLQSTYDSNRRPTSQYEVTDSVEVIGESLDPNQPVSITSNNKFQFSVDNNVWKTSLDFNTVSLDSTFSQKLYLRYSPGRQVCAYTTGTLMAQQGTTVRSVELSGICPRPTYIATPVVADPKAVTPFSFDLTWNPETDAEYYYLTMYHVIDQQETLTQGFEEFNDQSSVTEQGWQTSVYKTTQSQKAEGSYALFLENDGDYIISEEYVSAVSHISFWVHAFTTDDQNVANLLIQARSQGSDSWDVITTVNVTKTTKKSTKSFDVDTAKHYVQFRIDHERLGGKGIGLDLWEATCSKTAVYDYYGKEYEIDAMNDADGVDPADYSKAHLGNLTPSTEYFVRVAAYEDKGCEAHLSDYSPLLCVTTRQGREGDDKHLILGVNDVDPITYEPASHVVYLPETQTGASLYIYDTSGRLVYSTEVSPSVNIVALPVSQFTAGAIYAAKYCTTGKMGRKDRWVKFAF